jgi:hypothetical protein
LSEPEGISAIAIALSLFLLLYCAVGGMMVACRKPFNLKLR